MMQISANRKPRQNNRGKRHTKQLEKNKNNVCHLAQQGKYVRPDVVAVLGIEFEFNHSRVEIEDNIKSMKNMANNKHTVVILTDMEDENLNPLTVVVYVIINVEGSITIK